MKRFYEKVDVPPVAGGWRIRLDGRPIRTAAGQPQILPTLALAEAMAREWAGQGEEIDASAFPLRDLADYALDAVMPARDAAIAELLPYAETDTLCYRAEDGEALHARQLEIWEPLLAGAEESWGLRFERIGGIMHRPQPPETLARLEEILSEMDAFALAALKMLASLSASLVIAICALAPDADPVALWNAANLEEDWQAELWGRDAEAEDLRQSRFEAFQLAMRFARLARAGA